MPWYVGLDPSSAKAGLAAIAETGELRTHALHARGQVPERLATLRRDVRDWLAFAREDGAWAVVVEIPVTRFGNATLLASYGVFVEAAASLLRCPIATLTPGEVDDQVLGGRQPLTQRKARCMTHARGLGYDGGSQDVADALVCADAARAMTLRSVGSAA